MAGGNQTARTAQRTSRKANPFDERLFANRNDRWLTPLAIVNAVGPFDLDPCGAPHPAGGAYWPTAKEVWIPEEVGDGLAMPWHGRVWLNPPYGDEQKPWLTRLIEHGSGVALIPVATGTKVWQDLVFPHATAIHWWRHRVKFIHRDGDEDDMVAPNATALIAFSAADGAALAAANLPGVTHHYVKGERYVRTLDELEALPVGTIVLHPADKEPYTRYAGGWRQGWNHETVEPSAILADPVRVLYLPEEG
jgi:hypothetical protein